MRRRPFRWCIASCWRRARFSRSRSLRSAGMAKLGDEGGEKAEHAASLDSDGVLGPHSQLIEATAWGRQPRFLIRDRDACFGQAFVARARAIGIDVVLTPFRCPQANGLAERMVGTFRQQCLDHVIVLNERHLLRLVREYGEHYNLARPHRSLDLEAPEPRPRLPKPPDGGRVGGRRVLGGLHHEYYWEAVRCINGAPQAVICSLSLCIQEASLNENQQKQSSISKLLASTRSVLARVTLRKGRAWNR